MDWAKGKKTRSCSAARALGHAIESTLAGEGASVAVCASNADQVASAVPG